MSFENHQQKVAFLDDYFQRYQEGIFNSSINQKVIQMAKMMESVRTDGKKIIVAGNGGSAAMASHVAVDFAKQTGIRTVTFNDVSLVTCFANDFGYEYWLSKAIQRFAERGDLIVLISSSGTSPNIVNAAKVAKDQGCQLVTLTGFEEHNPVSVQADLQFWINSRAYNVIECVHQIWLLAVCDLIKGKAEYSAQDEYSLETQFKEKIEE
jgi:D-sedoheptulose 7-phosphate isomerase